MINLTGLPPHIMGEDHSIFPLKNYKTKTHHFLNNQDLKSLDKIKHVIINTYVKILFFKLKQWL